MSNEDHAVLFKVAVQVRQRLADRYEAIRGPHNWITIGLWILAGVGGAVAVDAAASRLTGRLVGLPVLTLGLIVIVVSVIGVVSTFPLVLRPSVIDQWGRLCNRARPFGWLLTLSLMLILAGVQLLLLVQVPPGNDRLWWHVTVLVMQVAVAAVNLGGLTDATLVSTRGRDGVLWQRRCARRWLFAQAMILQGIVVTLWGVGLWSIGTAGVVVALALFAITSHRARIQQIAMARDQLVESLTEVLVAFDRSGGGVSRDYLAGPLRGLQNLCNEDVSNPRTAFFGRNYLDADLALVVNYVGYRLFEGRPSPRQRAYAEFFRHGTGDIDALDSLPCDHLIPLLRELIDELRHRLHHPYAGRVTAPDVLLNAPVKQFWDRWGRDS